MIDDKLGIDGEVADGFEPVLDTFRDNFLNRDLAVRETGASVAIYVEGERVVNLWGGIADAETNTPWTEDTLGLVFSTTKGIAAICVAMLVEGGTLSYDEPVATYWPEFGANGKAEITLGQMLSHQAGLIFADPPLTREQLIAVDPVVETLAAQAPLWEPGTAHGYHALTYGWLVGEVVRRADGRRISQFLADEVAQPLGLEMWIGLPEEFEPRVSMLLPAPRPEGEELELMMKIAGPGTNGGRALFMDGALGIAEGKMTFNDRDVHATEMPAANGITNAASLARLYAATVGEVDGTRLTTSTTVDAMRAERVQGPDLSLVLPTRFGAGFMLNDTFLPFYSDSSFGHYGAGGSLGFADSDANIGFGYIMNQMGGGIAGDPRAVRLFESLRTCLA